MSDDDESDFSSRESDDDNDNKNKIESNRQDSDLKRTITASVIADGGTALRDTLMPLVPSDYTGRRRRLHERNMSSSRNQSESDLESFGSRSSHDLQRQSRLLLT